MNEVFRYGRFIYTRPDVKYVDKMVEMMNNENISSMLSINKKIITKEIELEWIKNHQNDNTFSIINSETMEYIGNCGFNEVKDNKGEIGITICENMQGKHYSKEIIKGLIEYGFNNLKLNEIYSIVFSDNIKSLNCMIQLGFKEYKRDKDVIKRNGKYIDDIYLNLKK